MPSLNEYREHVELLASLRNGEPISNGSLEHAAILIEQMFKSADRQVSILTSALNARVYARDRILDQAKMFLALGSRRLNILLESDDAGLVREHPFFERIRNNDNVEARRVPANVRNSYKYHFLVMDDDSYRFEPTKDAPTAVGVFGNKTTASRLSGIFSLLWDQSEVITLRPRAPDSKLCSGCSSWAS